MSAQPATCELTFIEHPSGDDVFDGHVFGWYAPGRPACMPVYWGIWNDMWS